MTDDDEIYIEVDTQTKLLEDGQHQVVCNGEEFGIIGSDNDGGWKFTFPNGNDEVFITFDDAKTFAEFHFAQVKLNA